MNMKFNELFLNNSHIRGDYKLASKLVALCNRIRDICDTKEIPPKRAAESILGANEIGPLVFVTPEVGRWSTVGGLGVMIDELSYGLALLG